MYIFSFPFQVITEYDDSEVDDVLQVTEKMEAHLTAAIVSNDALFLQKMLANTVNGTTYAGIRARCTGTILHFIFAFGLCLSVTSVSSFSLYIVMLFCCLLFLGGLVQARWSQL